MRHIDVTLYVKKLWTPAGRIRFLRPFIPKRTVVYVQSPSTAEKLYKTFKPEHPFVSLIQSTQAIRQEHSLKAFNSKNSMLLITTTLNLVEPLNNVSDLVFWNIPLSHDSLFQQLSQMNTSYFNCWLLYLIGERKKSPSHQSIDLELIYSSLKYLKKEKSILKTQDRFNLSPYYITLFTHQFLDLGWIEPTQPKCFEFKYFPSKSEVKQCLREIKKLNKIQQLKQKQMNHMLKRKVYYSGVNLKLSI